MKILTKLISIKSEDKYIRLTVTDAEGNTANTNAYFTDELFD